MIKRRIRLRGIGGDVEGKSWESETLLRVGRIESFEIVLDNASVSRKHAELRASEGGWQLHDLNSTNGTYVNGIRLAKGERRLQARDIIQFGKVTVAVERIEEVKDHNGHKTDQILVQASTNPSWEDALQGLAFDRHSCPRPGDQLLVLLRASHHLGHQENEDELLHSILNDAVSALDAQRGAIVLADGADGELRLRALATRALARGKGVPTGAKEPASRTTFSQSLAQRSFNSGKSILCCSVGDDPELATAQSIHEGAMASVLCVLLRTPRKRLGVLHLDRACWQDPFTEDDLHLADALAANVSAGIESAQLLRKQKELFLKTITALGQAIEMRDHYAGGHTDRVTRYSLLLGHQLALSSEEIQLIQTGTPLHDIGKIGIDDAILRKPGRLTPEEFEQMKQHTVMGANIVATIPDLVVAIPIVRSHHERWDGRGYPDGLAGEDIPRLARIVAVADAFDAMTSDRPYRKGLSADAAFAEVEKQSGLQFDPTCASAFLTIRERVIEEMETSGSGSEAPVAVSTPDATLIAAPPLPEPATSAQ